MSRVILTPLGPEPPIPDRDSVDSWSMKSMDDYLVAGDRRQLYAAASRAVERERRGDGHYGVISALAGAETIAARIGPEELAVHAARLDAYAAAYGLRGWYRTTDLRGRHEVAVNKIRSRDEGDAGRYFTHAADPMHGPERYWVVDRDSGRTAARFTTSKEAQSWIESTEGRPVDESTKENR